jgi:hypothetical protein
MSSDDTDKTPWLHDAKLNEPLNEYLDADNWAHLTPERKFRTHLMRNIAQQITRDTGKNFVLKGGTALMLAYGLPRFSTDLDYDGRKEDSDMTSSLAGGAIKTGIADPMINMKKNTIILRLTDKVADLMSQRGL